MPDENLTCEDCGEVYESTAATRKIKNKLGRFVCPDCLVEAKQKSENKAPTTEEPEEEEESEEEAPPARPAARPGNPRPR